MNNPAASYGVSKTPRNEASFGEYDPKRLKNYRETYVRKAEIAQLILLHQIYSLSGSCDLIFQGGTALRWCCGGSRFSKDLDFVTPLGADAVRAKLNRMMKAAEKEMLPISDRAL